MTPPPMRRAAAESARDSLLYRRHVAASKFARFPYSKMPDAKDDVRARCVACEEAPAALRKRSALLF
jgi:hypothetical protein